MHKLSLFKMIDYNVNLAISWKMSIISPVGKKTLGVKIAATVASIPTNIERFSKNKKNY